MRWSGPEQHRKPFQKSAGPVKPPRQVPPYLPTSRSGLITTGSCPTRSATGGSLPALTSSASCGASLRLLGSFAASVTTSGPSSLPMNVLLPAFCASAPAAMTPLSAPIASVSVSRDRSVRFHGMRLSSVMRVPLSRCAALCRLSLGSNHLNVRAHLPHWLVEVGADYRDISPASPGSSLDAVPVSTGPAQEGRFFRRHAARARRDDMIGCRGAGPPSDPIAEEPNVNTDHATGMPVHRSGSGPDLVLV